MRNIFVVTLLAGSALSATAFAQDNTEADVVVQPDAPVIKMDVPEPNVTVDQAAPDVSVSQPQPIITMTQPAPTITVNIPKPTITVRMPDPDVNVDMAQPEVSVSQGEPTVAVDDSGSAAVATDDGTDQANVQVDAAAANVMVRNSDQRPQINYESEEAQVTVNQEEGEPNIVYQNADGSPMDGSQAMADVTEDDAERVQEDAAAADPATGKLAPVSGTDDAAMMSETDNATMAINPSSTGQVQLTVEQITDYSIVGANGEVLGDIESVVEVNNRLFAVIGSGGFLGLGEKQVAIPLSSLVATEQGMMAPSVSESQVDALEEFDADDYPELEENMSITVGEG
ncbi:PRC-barrel domain-containing protein [Aurantimonas sp. A2-1-M11]|uniref:PRC-barrel domain-containing protein n=1 Tax=Aurantimonas sp. A2-1-M11 TaxID=3113712 RepID=UPI002F9296B3